MNPEKCIIFGAGKYGKQAYGLLKSDYEVIGFADNDPKKWGTLFCGQRIYCPDELAAVKDVEIIIASVYYAAIYNQLKQMGIANIRQYVYTGKVENRDGYMVRRATDASLFADCCLDWDQIEEVEKDFSVNYSLPPQRMESVSAPKAGKKVLFCAYSFPPIGESGVQRSLKFVKYLRKFGYEPVVLTVGKNDGLRIEDDSMLGEVPNDIQIIRVDHDVLLPELLTKEQQQEIFHLYMGVVKSENWMNEYRRIRQSTGGALIPDNKLIWVNQCLKQIEQQVDLRKIDIVFTTGNPFSSFFLGYYIKKKYGTGWVADYRDPWASHAPQSVWKDLGDTLELQQQLESKMVHACDRVVVAGVYGEGLAETYGITADQFVHITNGYDEDDFKDIRKKEQKNTKFTLCFNGSLYAYRNPLYLLRVINGLIEKKEIDGGRIQWIFNGKIEETWKNQTEEEDVYGIIRYNGYLSHSESIMSAIHADLLIEFGGVGRTSEILYCGKIFEYLRLKRPILSFSTKGGLLDKMFQKTHSGKNFEYQDLSGIEAYLLDAYHAWEQGIETYHPDEAEIQKYERRNLTRQLAEVFDRVLEEKGN